MRDCLLLQLWPPKGVVLAFVTVEFLVGLLTVTFFDMSWKTNFKASSCRALNYFMRSLYKSNVFMCANDAKAIVAAGMHFLQGYARLAVLSFNLRQPRFPMIPKIHMLFHVVFWMAVQSRQAPMVENPMTQNCACDEDFIGRFCALTRAVSPRLRIQRSFERYFTQVMLLWLRRGWCWQGKKVKTGHV